MCRLNDLCGFAMWLSLGVATLVVLTLCLRYAGLHWNLTDSVPRGLYRETHQTLRSGTLIAFCLPTATAQFGHERGYIQQVLPWPFLWECPNGYQPLLKTITAVAGDVVKINSDAVQVNDMPLFNSAIKNQDSQGRPLPHVLFDTYKLAPGELWVMSTRRANSWDSRYFGPIREESVIATAEPVWVW